MVASAHWSIVGGPSNLVRGAMSLLNYGVDLAAAKRSREHSSKQTSVKRIEFLLRRVHRMQVKLRKLRKEQPVFRVSTRIRADVDELLCIPAQLREPVVARLVLIGHLPEGFVLFPR
jgi:hypothetical protein